ncbi:N-acetylaspartate synthetase [Hemiscyllium ocellatum]|uniref:N-acetylaspartate synthetase n=1 Tax=Hemiscyllium ocellatum TaxID=170820 RepID=UPI0029669F24|nr:N-acetylaspartate synthetase [Hemiscyllium ocellatum]
MHFLPTDMVCQTKMVADEEMPPAKGDGIAVSSQIWLPAPPPSAPAPAPAPAGPETAPAPAPAPEGAGGGQRRAGKPEPALLIREFQPTDRPSVRRIFREGILERVPNTAFRGLKQQPGILLLYTCFTIMCFYLTKSALLTCCVPTLLLGMRYYYSRKVILSYLECVLQTDMSDIEQYYLKPTGSCFWVAVLDGNVVGIVAARGNEEDNVVELRRMSVDFEQRGKGIAKALGRRVLEFAMLNSYSAVVLGTTAVKPAAHKLYESLGFRYVGITEHYVLPGMSHSFLEKMFFQLRYHRYRLLVREE